LKACVPAIVDFCEQYLRHVWGSSGRPLVNVFCFKKLNQLFQTMQIRHGRCGTPQVFEVERQQDVRSPVYYRLERVQDSKQLSGYIHLKEFNALAKRDILIGILPFIPL